ncbi:hypothetical protein RHSP_83427 [Rhizobium freirei PRF 81]|uniref:Uncharacterized protein n=1 Tax=Rhizobium freirei PRF 81 TaxID=363754 RepID=N6V080_9HYPH|nr:hypothetical protein RHSP_83427 [Rhizobium freirei PRF 81]
MISSPQSGSLVDPDREETIKCSREGAARISLIASARRWLRSRLCWSLPLGIDPVGRGRAYEILS